MFPMRHDLYDYTSFLRAAAKYPKFCGEGNCPSFTDSQSCARELTTLFAHLSQETGYNSDASNIALHQQALYHLFEMRCADLEGVSKNDPSCDYKSTQYAAVNWPPVDGKQYFGRGPVQLSWNFNYGAFSNVLVESEYNSK